MKKVNVNRLFLLAVTITVCLIIALNYVQPVRSESVGSLTGEILSVVTLDYNRKTGEGGLLSTLGPVKLNNQGMIEGDKGKSGWVTINTWGAYIDKTTKTKQKILLKGVSFWVNKGGKNWWDFEVQGAYLDGNEGKELTIETKVEQIEVGINRPIIIVEGKYKLVPVVLSLNNITFSEEEKENKQTTQKIAVLPLCQRDSLDKDCEYTKTVSEILTSKLIQTGSLDVVSQAQVLDAVHSAGFSYYDLQSKKQLEEIGDKLSAELIIIVGPYPSAEGNWFTYKTCRSKDWMCKEVAHGAGFPGQLQSPKVDDKNTLQPILHAIANLSK